MIGIYCIQNSIDGKRYIGQSIDINRRIRDHKYLMKNGKEPNKHFRMACKKYGINNFVFVILKECKKEDLDKFEKEFIFIYKTMDDKFGYNLTGGGNFKKEISEKTRKILSQKNRRLCSDKTKKKLSDSHKGINTWMAGRKMSEETKAKLSAFWKGKPQSKELIEKRRLSLLQTLKKKKQKSL